MTAVIPPADAALLEALQGDLPDGWTVEVEAERAPGFEWHAFVYHAEGTRAHPLFTVARHGRAGLSFSVRWLDGSWFVSSAFQSLPDILDLIPGGIFAATEARLETAEAETATRH